MTAHVACGPTMCALSIAGLGVTLRCEDEQVVAALHGRYAGWLDTKDARCTIDVVIADDLPVGNIDLVLEGWTVRAATSQNSNSVQADAGYGEIVVPRMHALELIEYWLRVAYAMLVFRAGGLLLHAAGIVRDERAFLFCGRSGSGKTTVARLSPHDTVLNDDLVALMPRGSGGWIAHATPFSNSTQVRPTGASSAPVAAVLRLVQDNNVYLEPTHGGLALAELISNVPVLAADPSLSRAVFERCEDVLRAVPLCRLHFLPDPSFWPVVEGCFTQAWPAT